MAGRTSLILNQRINLPIHLKYRADIDGLRALAVLSVVAFHAFPSVIQGGFIGVDVFFVISGFLISKIISENLFLGRFSIGDFYIRRIKRIFPALLLVLFTSFAAGWILLLPDEYAQLGKHIASGAFFISNFLSWAEAGYFDSSAYTKPLLHLWSLGIEEQFYIFWPLILWGTYRRRMNLFTVTAVLAIVSFIFNMIGTHLNVDANFYSPATRAWELMIGSMLAFRTPSQENKVFSNIQSATGVGLFFIGTAFITKSRDFPGWWALLPTLGSALIISAGSNAWLNRTLLSNRILVWFGLISFPLYLWHWPILAFANIVLEETPSLIVRLSAVSISIFLAGLTFLMLEKPIRFGKQNKTIVMGLTAAMATMGTIGFLCYKLDGFGFRFAEDIRKITNLAQYENKQNWAQLGICFLQIGQEPSGFDLCKDPVEKGKHSLVIWGDSQAGHLYPGYKTYFSDRYNVISRTAASCPPLFDTKREARCIRINNSVLELIRKKKPEKVVLGGLWRAYDWESLELTIIKLKAIGIKNIDLIGPVPQWKTGLPRQLFRQYTSTFPHQIAKRMKPGFASNFQLLDLLMADFANKENVTYVSPLSVLCNQDGCLAVITEMNNALTSWDGGHLTLWGSRYLVSHFPKY